MSERDCPWCKGKGSSMAFVNRGPDISKHTIEQVTCHICGGGGKITREQADRMAQGKVDRDMRVAAMRTLAEGAAMRGCTPAQLSKWETAGVPIPSRVDKTPS